MNWQDILYLRGGSPRQRHAYDAICAVQIVDLMSAFDPLLVGTIPLEIDIESSDLDWIHYATDLEQFAGSARLQYENRRGFRDRFRTINGKESYIANFEAEGFKFELFAQNCPVIQQRAYRHMVVEHRLLQIGGEAARKAIRELKRGGMKTEPAFAQHFGIAGHDPYQDLLELIQFEDVELRKRVCNSSSFLHADS